MSLYHHDARNYHEAALDAGHHARKKLEELIAQGRKNSMGVIERVISEVPEDRIVKGAALQFGVDAARNLVVDIGGKAVERIHRNAAAQLLERGPVAIPAKFANELLDMRDSDGEPCEWARRMLANNLTEIYKHTPPNEQFLSRSYQGQLRGFLSNKYRRLDSRPLIDAAMTAFGKYGAVPVEAYGNDTRVHFKCILPKVFEPAPGEVLCIGVMWGNSDYGNGAHSVRVFILRLWCTNFGITEECLREVHLGSRLSQDDVFSTKTYQLDTERSASMVTDIIHKALSPAGVNSVLEAIVKANENEVDGKDMAAYLKKHVNKDEQKMIVDAFNSPDVKNLPPGNTTWRMSNAISWIAGKLPDKERGLELMHLAGEVAVPPAKKKAA
jgi:hypothetical protein